jgi:glycosyltransferase involved in cell wall biosynthesis
MNILMHCIYFPPEVGGLESHIYQLARWFVRQGHRVDVVTSRSLPDVPAHEVMEGVRVWRTWFPSRNPPGWVAHSLASTPRLVALAADADVVHAQAFASVPPGVVARRRHGTPLVASFHTSHFLRRAQRPRWRPILARTVRWPDYAMAASVEIARVAEDLAPGVTVEPFTNGVDTTDFRKLPGSLPTSSRRRLMAPRRLYEKNGVEYLVRAVPLIAESVDVEAFIVGDGPERPRLEALAGELGVADRVHFLGARPNGELPGLLGSVDLAVFPSLMEATSVAALEAMACERPVLATRVGGLPEIVDDQVGGLCQPGDPEDLARAAVRLLQRSDLDELGAHGRARVQEHWSIDRLGTRHLEVYEMVRARRRSGA